MVRYDFWYQPFHNVMISTEWGNVWALKDGFNPADLASGNYGTHLNVFDWKERKLIQRIDVGMEGVMPLEIRYCICLWHEVAVSLQVQIRQKYAWPVGFCTTPRPRKDSWAVPCMERFTDFTARLMRLVLSGQLKKLSTSPQSRWRAGLCQKCPRFSQTSSSA